MSNVVFKIFIRVIERRLSKGEDLEEILSSYSNLSEDEKKIIRDKFSK